MDGDRTLMRAQPAQQHYNSADNYTTTDSANPTPKPWIPNDVWSRTALIWSLAQFVVVGAIEAIILKVYREQYDFVEQCQQKFQCYQEVVTANSAAITIYHALVICALFFQTLLSFDSVLNSSMMQLVATAIFNLSLFGYSVIQWNQANTVLTAAQIAATQARFPNFSYHKTVIFEFAAIGVMAIFAIGWCFITFKLRRVFGWSVFKELGADFAVRRRLTYYYIYMMLLKLDVFFFLGFVGQYIFLVLPQKDKSLIWINAGIAFPATILLLVVAYFAVRRESNWLMALLLLSLSGAMGYLITKLVEIYVSPEFYQSSRNSMTFFEVITILMVVATFVVAILNFRNFGKGLIDQIKSRGNTKGHVQLDEMRPYNPRDPEANKNKNGRW